MISVASTDTTRRLPSNREAIPTVGSSLFITTRYGAGILLGIGLTIFGLVQLNNQIDASSGDTLLRALLMLGAGLTILAFCAYKLRFYIVQATVARELSRYGLTAQGLIVARWVDANSDGEDIYYVCYRFCDGYGARQKVDSSVFKRLNLGDKVKIQYLLRNPNLSRMDPN
jgi:hypothetical protein